MKLPSKKIIAVVFFCVALVSSVLIIKSRKDANSTTEGLRNISQNASTTKNKMPTLKDKDFYAKNIGNNDTSLTSNLSKDFFLNFVDLQNKGQWEAETQAELIDKLSDTYATTSRIIFKVSDIAVFSEKDTLKIHNFGNNTVKTIAFYNKTLTKESPIDILNEAVQSQNASSTILLRLIPIGKAYKALALDLKKIPAPTNTAVLYTDIINTYNALGDSVEDMQYYFSDPVRGFRGINTYQAMLVNQMYLLKNMAEYFDTNAIIFSDTEEGKAWNSLIK